ncbi:hypothetical protein B0H14DRAFT_3682449 [Mycena olivaceomarginata]|nr:hypothetical protein B0H14DRAFT_3682449 [Mycena olivaceomarginata]
MSHSLPWLIIFTSEMFNPVIKIHGRHISSVLQSFTIQMVLTVDICFTYSTDDLSNFHQISLDSQPGSNKPTAGRLVSELSRMVEDLFSPDNYELGILLCRLGVAIKFPNIRREKENGTRSWYKLDRRRARQINDGTKEPACRKHQPGFLNRGWFSQGVSSLELPPGYAPAAPPARPWARAGARSDGGGKKALMQISWVPASATEHWSARWECAGFSEKLYLNQKLTLQRAGETVQRTVKLHDLENTLSSIIASMYWTLGNIPPQAILVNADDGTIQLGTSDTDTDAPILLRGSAEVTAVSTQGRLDSDIVAVSAAKDTLRFEGSASA